MIKEWIKKYLPEREAIENHKVMQKINAYFPQPDIWRFTTEAIARGVALGLFVMFIPLPLQMLIAALLAVLVRANLPIAVSITWIANPFTFIPMSYFVFKVGEFILAKAFPDLPVQTLSWPIENHALFTQFSLFGQAYFVGLPVVAIGSAILGYAVVHVIGYISQVISHLFFRDS